MSTENKKEIETESSQSSLNDDKGAKKFEQERLLSDEFPYLNRQAGLQRDVQEDLMLTDTEFGSKHKRGKAARREFLQNLENRLELVVLRSKVEDHMTLDRQLQHLLSANEAGLMQSVNVPMNLKQAEVVFWLSSLTLERGDAKFTFDLEVLFNELKSVVTDRISIDILKNLIINISPLLTAQQIADREGLGRQAIYDRQDRIISRLDHLIENPDFKRFVEILEFSTCITSSDRMAASLSHPLTAICLLKSTEFPSVSDVVAAGYWLIARKNGGGKKSFRHVQRGVDNYLEVLIRQ